MNSRQTLRGFTLVEVLVALTIIAIAFTAIYRALAQSIDTTLDLRDRNLALWVAQNRFVQHKLEQKWPAIRTTSGTDELAGQEWHWQEQVQATLHPELRRIEIEVSHADGEHSLARLVGILRQPKAKPKS